MHDCFIEVWNISEREEEKGRRMNGGGEEEKEGKRECRHSKNVQALNPIT